MDSKDRQSPEQPLADEAKGLFRLLDQYGGDLRPFVQYGRDDEVNIADAQYGDAPFFIRVDSGLALSPEVLDIIGAEHDAALKDKREYYWFLVIPQEDGDPAVFMAQGYSRPSDHTDTFIFKITAQDFTVRELRPVSTTFTVSETLETLWLHEGAGSTGSYTTKNGSDTHWRCQFGKKMLVQNRREGHSIG